MAIYRSLLSWLIKGNDPKKRILDSSVSRNWPLGEDLGAESKYSYMISRTRDRITLGKKLWLERALPSLIFMGAFL